MKKIIISIFILLISVSFSGCAGIVSSAQNKKQEQNKNELQKTNESDEDTVKSLVKDFGSKLQSVSLQASKDIVKKSMQEYYGDYVSQDLIDNWVKEPLNAPGRLTSSPWPDRIEILSVENLSENEYEVKGEIVEITSVEKTKGGAAARRPITLRVKKTDNKWLISDVILGAYEEENSIVYKNEQYGFSFTLPESWKNYKIVSDKWEGLAIGGSQGEKIVETGPKISIRHPEWTEKEPRQDIPIMIFTIPQWEKLQQDKFHIGAAPIGPSELGRNNKYVFALPARYNFSFQSGYEEVENILNDKPLTPTKIQ